MTAFFYLVYRILDMTSLYAFIDAFVRTLGLPGWLTMVFDFSLFAGLAALIVTVLANAYRFIVWSFEECNTDKGLIPAVLCLLLLLASLFASGLLLSLAAIICGFFAATKGSRLGWVGFSAGLMEFAVSCLAIPIVLSK